ncbi:unnamed protein product [Gongylonema pulchrum]|uniref:TLE_N domain-containing protein n=1 Tax=Gongylonema pulchrum TaxID=637853 RepID=A0A183EBB3_9BILA|nr:unnamed protein product [Gongylonema pulchrum]
MQAILSTSFAVSEISRRLDSIEEKQNLILKELRQVQALTNGRCFDILSQYHKEEIDRMMGLFNTMKLSDPTVGAVFATTVPAVTAAAIQHPVAAAAAAGYRQGISV